MIYEFGKKTDGNATMRALLGGKGANLAEMSKLGLRPIIPRSIRVSGFSFS